MFVNGVSMRSTELRSRRLWTPRGAFCGADRSTIHRFCSNQVSGCCMFRGNVPLLQDFESQGLGLPHLRPLFLPPSSAQAASANRTMWPAHSATEVRKSPSRLLNFRLSFETSSSSFSAVGFLLGIAENGRFQQDGQSVRKTTPRTLQC